MARSPSYLGDVAFEILAAAVAAVDALDASYPKPARRYVEAGPAVAADCEQVVVYLPNLRAARRSSSPATAGRTIRGGGATSPVVPTAEFVTSVSVCVPVVDATAGRPVLPEPAAITAASQAAYAVFLAAWTGVFDAARAASLLPAGAGQASRRVEVGDLTTSGPAGGLASATFSTIVPV